MNATRLVGWVLLVPGTLCFLLLCLLSLVTQLQTTSVVLIGAATFIPLMWLPAVVGIVGLALVVRGWWRLAPAALAVAAVAQWGIPLLPDNGRDVASDLREPDLTIVSLNVQYGRADVGQLSGRIITDRTDLVALQEYTPDLARRLEASGLLQEFPHQVGSARDDAGGTMLLSRTPVEIVAETTTTRFDNFVARVDVAGTTWHVGVVHSTPPQVGARAWAQDGEAVNEMAHHFTDERLVLVGDFNAIDDHHTMRSLTRSSITNAMHSPLRQGRDAWQPTWPVGGVWPPFARIDHLLSTPRALAAPPIFFEVAGTDHKGLIGDVWARDE